MRRKYRKNIKMIIRIIILGAFLYGSYIYFMKNNIDAFFTRLVQLPFIYQIVESLVYWIIVLAIGIGIWKLTDHIKLTL